MDASWRSKRKAKADWLWLANELAASLSAGCRVSMLWEFGATGGKALLKKLNRANTGSSAKRIFGESTVTTANEEEAGPAPELEYRIITCGCSRFFSAGMISRNRERPGL